MRFVLEVVNQHPETAFIPTAILQATNQTLTRQVVHCVAQELDIHTHRDIVGHNRQADFIMYIAKVIDRFGLVGACVVGRGDDQPVNPKGLRETGVI